MKTIVKSQTYCDYCRRLFVENEPIGIKCPEGIWFCMKCLEKGKDTKIYPPERPWIIAEYTKGLEVVHD